MFVEFLRTIFLFMHLLLFVAALSVVVWSDFVLLSRGVRKIPLQSVKHATTGVLIGLWITGLIVVFIDTRFHIAFIAENPKLLLKLVCVSVLTFNGMLLHVFVFKMVNDTTYLTRWSAVIISIAGALSTTHWILAALIGSADMLSAFSFSTIFSVYLVVLLLVLTVAALISPVIHRKLNFQRVVDEILRKRYLQKNEQVQ